MDPNRDISNRRNVPREVPPSPVDQPHGAPVVTPTDAASPQQPPARTEPRSGWRTALQVIGALLAALLSIGIISSLAGFMVLSLAVASCARSCSDSPIGDSRATEAFIEDRATNERDLATFDALRGCIESLHDSRARYLSDGDRLATVDELRAMVANGRWPDSSAGYGDVESATNPQLWVRIAELSQNHIEEATNEQWDVVDFAYPFPDNGPIPVPPTRDEYDRVQTLLVCRSGEDAGLFATVDYWRWEQPARFEDHVEDARARKAQAQANTDIIGSIPSLEGRRFALEGSYLYVWEQGAEDPLRDPETFVAFVNEAGQALDSYTAVTLLTSDTPIMLRYHPLSYDYPNERDLQEVSFDAYGAWLLNGGNSFELDYAACDQLLHGYKPSDGVCEVDDLSGVLSPTPWEDYNGRWNQPDELATYDAELADVLLPYLSVESPEQVIAISKLDWDSHDYGTDTELSAWVIVPKGSLSEDPEGFCSTVNAMRDAVWDELAPEAEGEGRQELYLRIYVINEESVTQGDETRTFADLRAAALEDVRDMEGYSFEVLLCGRPSMTRWSDDMEPNRYDCAPRDVGGAIAQSREWRYGSRVDSN